MIALRMTYRDGKALRAGTYLNTFGSPIAAGDEIPIEYADNSRGLVTVMECSQNLLKISVGNRRWRLVPLNPQESVNVAALVGGTEITWHISESVN
jgi:hypothetical protein